MRCGRRGVCCQRPPPWIPNLSLASHHEQKASDGLLDVGWLSDAAGPCHGTFREILEDVKPLAKTRGQLPSGHPGLAQPPQSESCSLYSLVPRMKQSPLSFLSHLR